MLVCALATHEVLGMHDARKSDTSSSALDVAVSSPVMRLSSSPPPPSAWKTWTKPIPVAPSDSNYYRFNDRK